MHHQYFADLPPEIHQLSHERSIFAIAGVRLAPEMDQLLRTHIRTNPRKTRV
ncbi:hypothetical protein NP493_60g00034 [Ridgeia piscesae]|uniref:Uncharacterized protein n=1 Tax=Ridgeia piscesae TaxID=27915 RepID=A0AAD9PA65_RIDPI|nr:hypothetical protein NP493_60g00034 [Ridgeia piscesae]